MQVLLLQLSKSKTYWACAYKYTYRVSKYCKVVFQCLPMPVFLTVSALVDDCFKKSTNLILKSLFILLYLIFPHENIAFPFGFSFPFIFFLFPSVLTIDPYPTLQSLNYYLKSWLLPLYTFSNLDSRTQGKEWKRRNGSFVSMLIMKDRWWLATVRLRGWWEDGPLSPCLSDLLSVQQLPGWKEFWHSQHVWLSIV